MEDRLPAQAGSTEPPLNAWIARRRVPLGFLCGVIVLRLAVPSRATLTVGVAVASLGEAVRVWAAGHLMKGREVTTSGPYRLIAHPLYAGSSIMGIGLAIASGSLVVGAIVLLYLAVAVRAAMKSEEADLTRRFGEGYDGYRRSKARASSGSARRFSFAQAYRNGEHRALAGFLLAVLLLFWKATYNAAFWRAVGVRLMRPGG